MDLIRTEQDSCSLVNPLHVQAEHMSWLQTEGENDPVPPAWSRLWRRNFYNQPRTSPESKYKHFNIEVPDVVYSLWGALHPDAPVLNTSSRGKQYLACEVLACCAATLYPMLDWTPQLLDTIVINGDRYHSESLARIKRADYEFSLEDLNASCSLENIRFTVHLEHVVYGQLYDPALTCKSMNLAKALTYFFGHHTCGILQCQRRSLAVGRTKASDEEGFFMYDCQSRDYPLFPQGQGATYVLHCRDLQSLLYCIVETLNVRVYDVQFSLHKTDVVYNGVILCSTFNGNCAKVERSDSPCSSPVTNSDACMDLGKQLAEQAKVKFEETSPENAFEIAIVSNISSKTPRTITTKY